jgi:hypothetical protein
VLAVLTVKTSHSGKIEIVLEDVYDTLDALQWRFGGGGVIRTYAIDHGIHSTGSATPPEALR